MEKKLRHRPFSSLPTIQFLIAYSIQIERAGPLYHLRGQRGKGVVDRRMLLCHFCTYVVCPKQ